MKLLATMIAALAALALPAAANAQDKFAWPGGREAAIVLTYDDAATSQLDNAVPALDEAGIKATFFLNVRFGPENVDRWRAVAAEGHELGNHTFFHPCPKGSFAMEKQYESEGYSTKGMLAEIAGMNTLLRALDGKTGRTMGVPCGKALAGGQDYIEALRASRLVRYVRDTIDGAVPFSDPRTVDPFRVPSVSFPTSATAADYIAWVEKVRAAGGLGVIVFHGVGGDWLQVTNEAHRGLLKYLREHDKQVWVAPFQTVMDHVVKARVGK